MSKDKKKFKLIREYDRSEFHNELLVDEYKELIENNLFIDDNLHINTVYLVENDYEYEVGIYITNNSNKEILIKEIPIILKSKTKIFKEKILFIDKNIDAHQAIFVEVKLHKKEFVEMLDINSCDIELGNTNLLNRYNYTKIKFDGLEKVREKLGYREIKKFIKNLPLIEEDSLALNVFATDEVEEGFLMIILFRNTSKEDINIKSIPFEVYTENDLLIYKNNFISDDGISIPKYTGIFKIIVIPRNEFPIFNGEKLNNYKIIIK